MPSDSRITPSAAWRLVAAALLLACIALAYAPAVQGDFIWDDDSYVTANPVLRDAHGLWRMWTEPRSIPQYYPVVHTTFWLEYQIYGPWAPGYHTVNIALHAAGSLLLAVLLARLGLPRAVAWGAAAVFALHPIHVESVAWITERKNVLSGACYLAAMLAYIRFAGLDGTDREQPEAAPRRWGAYALALLCFILALLSKSVTATLPAAALLLVYWRRGRIAWRDIWPMLPFFAAGVAAGLHTAHLERSHVGAVGPDFDFSWLDRVLIAGRASWFYLAKLIAPLELIFIYPRWNIDPAQPWQYLYPIGVVAVLALLWRKRHRWGRGPLVALLFFGGTLMPALGFANVYPMRFSFVADHFQYLASIGIIVLAVALARHAWMRMIGTGRRRVGTVLAGVVLGLLAAQTHRQAYVYRDYETVWTDTLSKNPDSWIAHYNLAFYRGDQGDRDAMHHHLREVIRIKPEFAEAYRQLGAALAREGRMAEAEPLLLEAIALEPDQPRGYFDYGMALAATGDHARAVAQLERAVNMAPERLGWRLSLARSYLALGAPEPALAHVQAAASRGESDAAWDVIRGEAMMQLKRWPAAEAALSAAVAAMPGDARPRTLLAVTLMRLGRGDEALEHFARAAQLDPADPAGPMNEAAALAELGRFDQAVAAAQRAQQRALARGDHRLAARLGERIATYRQQAGASP